MELHFFGTCMSRSFTFLFRPLPCCASGQSLAQLMEQAQRTTADGHLSTMVQKTVVCRSSTVKHLHSGSFAELYLGKWRDDQVAIKVFSERHSDVWYKEVEVYQVSCHSGCGVGAAISDRCCNCFKYNCSSHTFCCIRLWSILECVLCTSYHMATRTLAN